MILINILNFILTTILVIIIAIIVLLLLILFGPIRYTIDYNYDEDLRFKIDISYFFKMFLLEFDYDGELSRTVRIFYLKSKHLSWIKSYLKHLWEEHGITLKRSEKRKKEVFIHTDEMQSESFSDQIDASKIDDFIELNKDAEDKHNRFGKIGDFSHIIELLSRKYTRRAIESIFRELFKALRSILPKNPHIYVEYGLNNPYYTAVISTIISVMYIYLGDRIELVPVMNDTVLRSEGNLEGKVTLIVLLICVLNIYNNKDCRKVYRRLRIHE